MTPFEKRLKNTPLRHPPAAWREEILAAAVPDRRPSGRLALMLKFRNPQSTIRNFLWPHPAAWGALAACWLVIAALNFSGPRGPALYAVTPPGMTPLDISPQLYAAYLEARDLFLAETPEPAPPPRLDHRKL